VNVVPQRVRAIDVRDSSVRATFLRVRGSGSQLPAHRALLINRGRTERSPGVYTTHRGLLPCRARGLGGWGGEGPSRLTQVLGDAALSDYKAKLEQLAVDARRAPQRIVHAHPTDQHPQVCVDLRPTSQEPGFSPPVPAETLVGVAPTTTSSIIGAISRSEKPGRCHCGALGPNVRDGARLRLIQACLPCRTSHKPEPSPAQRPTRAILP
jgi:hypothetical protein